MVEQEGVILVVVTTEVNTTVIVKNHSIICLGKKTTMVISLGVMDTDEVKNLVRDLIKINKICMEMGSFRIICSSSMVVFKLALGQALVRVADTSHTIYILKS